jgi:hypothetical protein
VDRRQLAARFDPVGNRVQSVGGLHVRPPAERVRRAVSPKAGSERNLAARETASGRRRGILGAGRLPAAPGRHRDRFSRRCRASVSGRLATISVPRNDLAPGPQVDVALVDAETSKRRVFGEVQVGL